MYTDDEVESSVAKFLTTDITTPRSQAGTRDVTTTTTQVFEIVSTAFFLSPDAIFYLTWLASNQIRALLAQQLEDMVTVVAAAPGVYKTSKKISSTTELNNAQAALLSLTAAFNARSSGVSGAIGPGINRFTTSVSRFMRQELAQNVVQQGDVTQTPEELRATIQTTWSQAYARQIQISELLANLTGVLPAYDTVRLPDSVVGSLLSRIQDQLSTLTTQMQAPGAAQQSRDAFLDLSTMNTLLTKASSFAPPVLKEAPLVGDPTTGVLVGPNGDQASFAGTTSGPFNYAAGVSLSLTIDGTPLSVALPSHSQAELRSQDLGTWAPPPAGSELTVTFDGSTFVTLVSSSWSSGVVAAAAMSGVVPTTWDTGTNQLVLRSADTSDASYLALDTSTADRLAFVSWLLLQGATAVARGVPVEAEAVRAALAAATGDVLTAVYASSLAQFNGSRSTTSGQEAVLWNQVVQGSVTSNGTTTLQSSSDLGALGLVVGMRLVLTPAMTSLAVLAVDGDTVEVDSAVTTGSSNFFAGPDYSAILAGTRVSLAGYGGNAGWYRVLFGGDASITLDRDMPVAGSVTATLYTEYLELALRGTAPGDSLGVNAGAGATALGLTAATRLPGLTTLAFSSGDLTTRGIAPGDLLVLTAPSGDSSNHLVSSIASRSLGFTPGAPYQAGNWRYEVDDIEFATYDQLSDEVLAQTDTIVLSDVDTAIQRLIKGARYSAALQNTLNGYVAALGVLLELMDSYVVPRDTLLDAAVRTMQEQGFDRALDIFLSLDLTTFFALTADGVSYLTWAVRKSADVAREVVPVSKDTADPTTNWRTLATQATSYNPSSEITKD